jgi:acyl-CoA thioesterase
MTGFADALALHPHADGALRASVAPGWDVRGIPHGGYLLALVGAAASHVAPQPHPLSVAATYLAPPGFGPADLWVESVRAGRRQSTLSVRLVQDDIERVRATVTVGTLAPSDPRPWAADAAAPAIPPVDRCVDVDAVSRAEGEVIALHEHLLLRLRPDTGWLHGAPSGEPRLDGWLRLADDTEPDPLALLMFSDGLPPSLFEAIGSTGDHVPTVQLTTHLFALPAPGWVQTRCRTRIQGSGFVDEDCDLWDSHGRLVGTARQLALFRTR